jgi:hypothetical protein
MPSFEKQITVIQVRSKENQTGKLFLVPKLQVGNEKNLSDIIAFSLPAPYHLTPLKL